MTTALDTRAARGRRDRFYRLVRATARFWLWFFFKSVDVRHPERVPDAGPVLLCINHPNNFIDSLLVGAAVRDRKSTRLNSSHGYISYAVFCLKKKKETEANMNLIVR